MDIVRTARLWVIYSTSKPNRPYEVRLCSDGSFVCSCPDFRYRNHECKHIKKVKMCLAGEKQRNKLFGGKE
ncbi:MAG: hypothetical protein U9N01_04335 [Euryarchaeota archaeon]|nr:hypothetical protein [Euryarchaeota archaeon]